MYKYYPEELIEEIRMSNDILSVVGSTSNWREKARIISDCVHFTVRKPFIQCRPEQAAVLLFWMWQGRERHTVCYGSGEP